MFFVGIWKEDASLCVGKAIGIWIFPWNFLILAFVLRNLSCEAGGVVYNEIKRKQVQIVEEGRPWDDKAGKGFLH